MNSALNPGLDAAEGTPPSADAQEVDLAPLQRMVGFNIHILDLQLYQLFYQRYAALTSTPGVFSTLLAIRQNPGIRHGALADALMIQRPNLTKLINRLESEGLVRRLASRDDKRHVVLHLSERGERRVAELLAPMREHDEAATAGLSAAERETFLDLLQRLNDGLRRRNPAAEPGRRDSNLT
jgi:DNA-binding MarR family transcriptional regulator